MVKKLRLMATPNTEITGMVHNVQNTVRAPIMPPTLRLDPVIKLDRLKLLRLNNSQNPRAIIPVNILMSMLNRMFSRFSPAPMVQVSFSYPTRRDMVR